MKLKSAHNTFRVCRVHFFRQPFSKKLYIQSRLVFLSRCEIHARSTRYANVDKIINLRYARRGINCGRQEKPAILISRLLLRMRRMYVASIILDPSAYGFGNARVSSRKLCAGVAKIWLFEPLSACSLIQPKLFASFMSTSSRKTCSASVLELKKFS